MKRSLIIGNTAQLANYFPSEYDRISSRNIDFDQIKKLKYERIYLLFAEQRTYLQQNEYFFDEVNLTLTISVIDHLHDYCEKLIVYSTSELWNNYHGCISLSLDYNFNYTPYIKSKEKMCRFIRENRDKYKNVIIVYPFNFNSVWRKEGFLFSKIFDSIINKNKITIGDINFNRDLIHPKMIADISSSTQVDIIIGSGLLINVKEFIKDIYHRFDMEFEYFVNVDSSFNLNNKRLEYYNCVSYSSYEELLELTIKDIYEYKISQRHD